MAKDYLQKPSWMTDAKTRLLKGTKTILNLKPEINNLLIWDITLLWQLGFGLATPSNLRRDVHWHRPKVRTLHSLILQLPDLESELVKGANLVLWLSIRLPCICKARRSSLLWRTSTTSMATRFLDNEFLLNLLSNSARSSSMERSIILILGKIETLRTCNVVHLWSSISGRRSLVVVVVTSRVLDMTATGYQNWRFARFLHRTIPNQATLRVICKGSLGTIYDCSRIIKICCRISILFSSGL